MNGIKDKISLLRAFYRASFVTMTKSPENLWLATIVQLFYYVAQIFFWFGIKSTAAGQSFISDAQLMGFLVTLSLADNIYLFLLGGGTVQAAGRIVGANLEPILMWPRSALGVLVFAWPNWSYLLCAVLSLIVAIVYFFAMNIALSSFALYIVSILLGIFVLDGISFAYRLSVFWTSSLVQIRHSNPSFKIMVRPLSAYQGSARLIFLTVFPALFITGVPAEILSMKLGPIWILAALGANLVLWSYVSLLWRAGVARYGKFVI